MNRKYNLKLDLQFRCNNSIMKFNQFDNNTSDFFIKISSGGKSFDVEKAIVVLAVIKPSGKVASQFIEVKNGLVYADLKPNMKDEIGTYTAQAMLILEDERVVTDSISYEVEEDKIFSLLNDTVETTEEFTLLTDMLSRLSTIEISEEQRVINEAERILSEENRKIEEAKRVEAELIRQHEEADRAKYDATRESNENIRKQNESIRLANETNRIDEEAKRVKEENKRKLAEEERNANYNFMTEDEERRRSEANAHKEAEALRVSAENTRVNEEAKRRTTEQARVSAENTRVSNENTRKANETTRQNNETQRVEAETQRQNRYNSFITDAEANANNFENYTNTAKVKEEERKSNELNRKSQEDRRVSNEVERISNENTRKANEKARQKNETSRQNIFENKVDEFNEKIVELNTTKDNFVSSINTKVDNKISELDNAKSDMTNTVSNKVNEVETRFNALTSSQQQDAEVIDARDGETSLKARLDRDIEKAKQVYVNVEGSYISTDSSSGYLKDVEILGNTIQSASNLADIRSVGDTVEGQELYEIPVLSRGKNLAKDISDSKINDNDKHWIVIDNGDGSYKVTGDGNGVNGFALKLNVKVTPNTTYTFSFKVDGVYPTLKLPIYVYKDFNALWDSNKMVYSGSNYTFTTPSDTNKICLGFYYRNTADTTSVMISDIQLEEGTVATPYEPYQEDKLTILSPTPLEKVGGVADRIICKDGVWGVEKNIVESVLDSNTTWSGLLTVDGYTSGWRINNYSNVICDKLKQLTIDEWRSNTVKGLYSSSTNMGIIIPSSELNSESSNGLNEWIKSNQPSVKYPTTQPQFIPLPHDQQVKLRTFANKTNISFLTETEGTIKAQVPKSLGATVNTHTEQINDLNKELDRVKKLEESTVSTVTTESGFTTVEATSNGYFEDVKLEGKTLVNLSPISSIEFEKTEEDRYVFKDYVVPQVKRNTLYTICVDITSNQSTNDTTLISFINDGSMGTPKDMKLNGTGHFVFTQKTLDVDFPNGVKIRFANASNGNLGVYKCENLTILEGDHTQNPPSYFEGLKSVGQSASEDGVDEVSVESVNENLIPTPTYRLDIPVGTSSNGYPNTVICRNIPIKPNTTYRVSYGEYINKGNIGGYPIRCMTFRDKYDGDNAHVNAYTHKNRIKENAVQIFTTEADAKYLVITTGNFTSVGNIEITELCLTESSVEKPYTPHQSDKKRLLYYNNETQAWEKPILRQWDSIEKHADGKYYYHQRSGEVVLNGSESTIRVDNNTKAETITFAIGGTGVLPTSSNITGNITSDKFITRTGSDNYNNELEGVSINGKGEICINILKSKLSTQDAQGFKQWLQANNVTVVYQLAQEKVYECTNIDLITYANETNYVVESGVLSPKTTLKVHNNISNVVSLLQKKVSLLENNITSYMITQNRLMLASRYNADTVSFKVDVASFSDTFEYDNDLYELILNNILVGKDNYNREYIENLIIFYWMDFIISDEMYSTLFEIIEEQHNPKIEEEETPLI